MVRERVGGFTISTVANRYEIHPQTLRSYEREGLLTPSRTQGNTRLYSEEDLEQLELILTLRRHRVPVNINNQSIFKSLFPNISIRMFTLIPS